MSKDLLKEFDYYIWDESSQLSKRYLQKYWLSDEELKKWISIKNKVFNKEFTWLPDNESHEFRDQVFNNGFVLRPILGGGLFSPEYLEAFGECMKTIGEKHFVIIEDPDEKGQPRYDDKGVKIPLLKFKYPVGIRWNEYMPGEGTNEGVTYELHRPVRNYFVFGDSGIWGKYTANDANEGIGVDIIGLKPEYLDLFKEHFPVAEKERGGMEAPLPDQYIERIAW